MMLFMQIAVALAILWIVVFTIVDSGAYLIDPTDHDGEHK